MKITKTFSFLSSRIFLVFSLLCLSFPGCKKEGLDPLDEWRTRLIGTWQAIPTDEYKPYKDLIIEFKADNTIDLYFPHQGNTYYLISETELKINWKEITRNDVYKISFNKDQTITIYNFDDGTTSEVEKNITFKKTH